MRGVVIPFDGSYPQFHHVLEHDIAGPQHFRGVAAGDAHGASGRKRLESSKKLRAGRIDDVLERGGELGPVGVEPKDYVLGTDFGIRLQVAHQKFIRVYRKWDPSIG